MDTNTAIPKYFISVLMDSSKASHTALTNAVQLAKTLGGRVEVFYAKAPTDVVKFDNQLSAMRAIHEENRSSKNRIKNEIKAISQEEGLPISVKTGYGNLKTAVKDYVNSQTPDIIVLGRRKSKVTGFLTDGVTDFVINECPSHVLILGEDDKFHSFANISLGVFGNTLEEKDFEIVNDLKNNSSKPVRLFNIKSEEGTQELESKLQQTVSYVFSEGANAIDGLTSYVKRTKTELFCMPKRTKGKGFGANSTKQVMRKLDVPILIMAG
ncbi:universal stress protein [Flagellimonas allohymeniacidonis]|uniref:Universal stress protein n=1 Tax=Flagellimonas allohymeniacidonis TaxID=2517819 RepID=A0A4Q8QKN7_9FLAO|nr:universal stress protein [Allomuricauda hymeniacidonis]TAI48806.1 universal stress protein [Allomuricauda hymeniacidonis]